MNNLYPYLRTCKIGDKEYVRNEVPGKCNFFEQEYTCELRDGNKIIKYSLAQFVYMFINNFEMNIILDKKICEALSKLKDLSYYYTADSLDEAFKNYPYTLQIIKNETSFGFTDVRFSGCGLEKKGMFPTKSYFFDNYETKWAIELRNIADSLMKEVIYLKIDFDKLKKKESILKNTNVPKWLIKAAAIGGVVLIKLAVKSIANSDTDIDIPDFDGDADITSIDIDSGEICNIYDGYFDADFDADFDANPDGNLDCNSISNSISFLGSSTPSFDTGNDVHVMCETGLDKGYFDVFSKDGNKYIKFGIGSSSDWSNWVLIQGKRSFVWKGVKYYIK